MSPVKSSRRFTGLTILLASTALILSGCGDKNESKNSSDEKSDKASSQPADPIRDALVYDFEETKKPEEQQKSIITQDQPLIVKPSADLQKVLDEKMDDLKRYTALESATVEAKSFSTGMCRTDITPHYAKGVNVDDVIENNNQWQIEQGFELDVDSDELVAQSVFGAAYVEFVKFVDEVPADKELEKNTVYIAKDYSKISAFAKCDQEKPIITLETMAGRVDLSTYQETRDESEIATMVSTSNGSTNPDVSDTGEWTWK